MLIWSAKGEKRENPVRRAPWFEGLGRTPTWDCSPFLKKRTQGRGVFGGNGGASRGQITQG